MKALVIYSHPRKESFNAAVRDVVIAELKARGAEIRLRDLYAENFDPVFSADELANYEDAARNRAPVAKDIEDLFWCDSLIFVYPTWTYGLPAILKGWLDRTTVPGVAFKMPEDGADIRPGLTNIQRIGCFTTCGASRWLTFAMGAPGRRTILRGLKAYTGLRTRTVFAAHYLMDSSTSATREQHLDRVRRLVRRF